MRGTLLTVDWDYFVPEKKKWNFGHVEDSMYIDTIWYIRAYKYLLKKIDLQNVIVTNGKEKNFWTKVKKIFNISKKTKVYISDSHKYAYDIAQKYNCKKVYNFDSHSDLGYGGLDSLLFEVNCANWLGKLFYNNIIKQCFIIYSKHTLEKEEEFSEFKNKYDIKFIKIERLVREIIKDSVDAILICRSGAWTPPWLDNKFFKFVKALSYDYKKINFIDRKWNPNDIYDLSKQIEYTTKFNNIIA